MILMDIKPKVCMRRDCQDTCPRVMGVIQVCTVHTMIFISLNLLPHKAIHYGQDGNKGGKTFVKERNL